MRPLPRTTSPSPGDPADNDLEYRPPTVALLGTGIMGVGMARNILAAGLLLRVWNRTAEKARPLGDEGAVVAATPADAVRGADVIITMLGDRHHVADTMTQAVDGLAAGQVWAQMTTVGIDQSEIVALAAKHGLLLVDAPVSGTKQPAEQGQLLVLAAGAPAAASIVQPVFDAVGRSTRWIADDAGDAAASRLKLVVNSWVLAVTTGTAEVLALARGLDVDPQAFFDVVDGGPLDLGYMRNKATSILAADWTPNFSVDNAVKDAELIVEAGRAAGLQLDGAAASAARLHRVSDAGHGDADLTATYLADFTGPDDDRAGGLSARS